LDVPDVEGSGYILSELMTVTDCVTLRIFEVGSTDGNRVICINVMQTSKKQRQRYQHDIPRSSFC
jgi:hypothetical protein